MKNLLWMSIIFLASSCSRQNLPVSIVSANASGPAEITFAIKTEPGASVRCGYDNGSSNVIASPDGSATFVYDASKLELGPQDIDCSAKKKSTFGERWGYATHRATLKEAAIRQNGGKIECTNKVKCEANLEWTPRRDGAPDFVVDFTNLELDFKYAKGTIIELGETRETSPDVWTFTVSTSLRPQMLRTPLADVKIADLLTDGPPLVAEVPLKLTFTNGTKASGLLHGGGEAYRTVLFRELRKLEKGPVRFDGEGSTAGSRSLLAIGAKIKPRLFGTADRMRDVDRVALLLVAERIVSCGMYQSFNAQGLPMGEEGASLTFEDLRAIVYDRRTGKKLAERTFVAPAKSCPSSYSDSHYGKEMTSSADSKDALEWVAKLAP